jgi:hypothetical protein
MAKTVKQCSWRTSRRLDASFRLMNKSRPEASVWMKGNKNSCKPFVLIGHKFERDEIKLWAKYYSKKHNAILAGFICKLTFMEYVQLW